jgi:hypothetical protein
MARYSDWNRYTLTLAALGASSLTAGCLERDLGLQGPRTTSLISEQLRQAPPNKLDLLIVVDNSRSMADKQQVMAAAIPDLIRSLVEPPCVDDQGARVDTLADGRCPAGSNPEFEGLRDLQVGVITTSLGGSGGETVAGCLDESSRDMAHLLPTRPRAAHIPSDDGVLAWKAGTDLGAFIDDVGELVTLAGENGCGQEATLEAWYRFLVDPAPYTQLVRKPCDETDTLRQCSARELAPDGSPAVDTELLAQRAKFLRQDSLVAIVMLTDENDCSVREHSKAWTLADADYMWSGAAACQTDPDSECCVPCTIRNVPAACPTEPNAQGTKQVPLGCAQNDGYLEALEEQPNLRCFDQKRRFGIDFLQPTARYVNALTARELCGKTAAGASEDCAPNERFVNPLFASGGVGARTSSEVFLVGILGVPWQDIAVSPNPNDRLAYLPAVGTETQPGVNWSWLLPSETQDPLMRESVEPRTGVNPATGAALAPGNANRGANPINGHEHTNANRDELQFACTFPLPEGSRQCSEDESEEACDCTSDNSEDNPLCQAEDNSFGAVQYFAKAYPGVRHLQVLSGVATSAVVASICPKEMADVDALDFGYRPAMQAVVDKLKTKLTDLCFDRELSTDEAGVTNCKVIEMLPQSEACTCTGTRRVASELVMSSVRSELLKKGVCETAQACAEVCGCEITQVAPGANGALNSCQTEKNTQDNGWCYVDASKGPESAQLVANCVNDAKQSVRFVGDGVPLEGSVTFLACQGSSYDVTP